MKQQTLAMAADAQSGFEQHRKPTRRDEFLKTMDALVPWAALCDEVAPHYPKAGNGRPPIGLARMRRIHFIQHWFNLALLPSWREYLSNSRHSWCPKETVQQRPKYATGSGNGAENLTMTCPAGPPKGHVGFRPARL